jgi:hypothetical protein
MNNINPALVNAFLNMMMNQNVMNNNQMDLNKMVNPNIFQIIQNGGVLPRATGVNNNKTVQSEDLFPGNMSDRINVIFETGTGLKFNFPTPLNVPVSQLLHKFIRKVGVSETLLGTKIFFIINGKTIPINEPRSVANYFSELSYGINGQVKIVVIDGNNVIGALNHGIYRYS